MIGIVVLLLCFNCCDLEFEVLILDGFVVIVIEVIVFVVDDDVGVTFILDVIFLLLDLGFELFDIEFDILGKDVFVNEVLLLKEDVLVTFDVLFGFVCYLVD